MKRIAFLGYLLFTISWFLHLGSRISALGLIRFDMVLVGVLVLLCFLGGQEYDRRATSGGADKFMKMLIVYSVVTIPFVEWPGSVLRSGLENFAKAAVFYFFTKIFVTSEKKLRTFTMVFLVCQSFRICEPLYLHQTQGYWGESAYTAGEILDRLAGAPSDVIGANGLAFVILTVLPFVYFLRNTIKGGYVWLLVGIPILLYTLSLTASRSGVLGLGAAGIGILLKSRVKALVGALIVVIFFVGFGLLSPELQERYLSIFMPDTKSAATVEGRVEGVKGDFRLAFRRPMFGHGLGTSREVNFNFRGDGHLAHNLYAEAAQELGFVGLAIFLMLVVSVVRNFVDAQRELNRGGARSQFLVQLNSAMQVWMGMNLLFSFASYGLSSYEWYLFGGLSVVVRRLAGRTEVDFAKVARI